MNIYKYELRCIRCFNYGLKPSIFFEYDVLTLSIYSLFYVIRKVNMQAIQRLIFVLGKCVENEMSLTTDTLTLECRNPYKITYFGKYSNLIFWVSNIISKYNRINLECKAAKN